MNKNQKVTITKNGPYLISGSLPLSKKISIVGSEGDPEEWQQGKQYPKQENYALCRCGKSQNKPYCDGTHAKVGFNGTETANKKPYEKDFEPSIDLIEDPQAEVSGGIWLKGGIGLESADGSKYESRNRMTLCRCGKSNNKPFCDGSHINVRFNDGDESLKKIKK